ncbi:MAG TPA: hypothetical protein VF149_03335 [Bacillales bacterium]
MREASPVKISALPEKLKSYSEAGVELKINNEPGDLSRLIFLLITKEVYGARKQASS